MIKLEEEQFIQRPLIERLYSPFSGDFSSLFCCFPRHVRSRKNFLRKEFGTLRYLINILYFVFSTYGYMFITIIYVRLQS